MKLGIGGVVTFKNGKIDQFLNKIEFKTYCPRNRFPLFSPNSFSGKRNESSYLVAVVDKLAQIYSLSAIEIAAITTENSKVVFGI
jgi:TatD DNase family protein